MICNKEHRYLANLATLPENQGGEGRHLCAGCAYEQGLEDGLQRQPRKFDPSLLNESQAGTGRHKDPEAAYNLGFDQGSKLP